MAQDTKKDTSILSDIGIEINNEKIAIDTAKTKEFFGNIQQQIQDTAQNISENMEKGTLDMSQNVGIKVDDGHIEVDLNKTKSFIEEIGEKIEHFLAQLEHSVDKLSKK